MQMEIRKLTIVGMMLLALGCTNKEPVPTINFVNKPSILLDGDLQDWQNLSPDFEVRDFQSPWDAAATGSTTFKALRDSTWFYFSFDVEDSLIVSVPFEKEIDVADGDRVEIFLSGDTSLRNYYCLEISPQGKVLDYQSTYYRKFDNSWNMDGLQVYSRLKSGGYTVEGRIPISFLQSQSVTQTDNYFELWLGLYRAEYSKKHTETNPVQWITWIDPSVKEPDFHIPTSFHKVRIQKQ